MWAGGERGPVGGIFVKISSRIKNIFASFGIRVGRMPSGGGIYDADGLTSVHNHEFLRDPAFIDAYERGVRAAGDYDWHWRVHIGLWSAESASRLDGDFVECGVNRGFLSSAIMQYLDWNNTGKNFYLLDTFAGLDPRYAAEGARRRGIDNLESGFYVRDAETVRQNFAEWENVRIIVGAVPETLVQIDAEKIAFLHLDMNCPEPEVAAFEFLWPKLVPGAFVLLDDYAYRGYSSQKSAMDAAAARKQVRIASLPTGQGLLIKPAI